jgi:UDP-N-acetylglucosamine acyltransferase
MSTQIDSQARVSPKAVLGSNVSIGPFTIVEGGAVIGDGTTVAANALIGCGARIGRDCRIHHGAVVGHAPQDLKYANEPTTCELGDRNIIREYAVLHRGTGDAGRTLIGSDNFFMAYTHVAHDCVIGDHVILANSAQMAGHVDVGDWVIVGGLTPIHQFVHIGRHAMVGGATRVRKDVPPFVLVSSDPASFEGLNSIGLRRRGFSREVIDALDRAYTLLYGSKLNVSQAVARIREDASLSAVPEVGQVLDFIARSNRGIIPGPRFLS